MKNVQIQMHSKNGAVSEAERNLIEQKLSFLDRFVEGVISVHINLESQRLSHTAKMSLHVGHLTARSEATTDDMYASIDLAASRLKREVTKYRKQITDHGSSFKEIQVSAKTAIYTSSEEDDFDYDTALAKAKTEDIKVKEMSDKAAMISMDLSKDKFMLYRSTADHRLKIIYRRPEDRQYVIINADAKP